MMLLLFFLCVIILRKFRSCIEEQSSFKKTNYYQFQINLLQEI